MKPTLELTSSQPYLIRAWHEWCTDNALTPYVTVSVDASVQQAIDRALAAENERWTTGRLDVDRELVGDRPAGRTAEDSPMVRAIVSVTRALDLPVALDEGSTDSNIAMSLGVPAVTIDGGGRGSGAHSLAETFDSTDSWKGTQRALLAAVALAAR